MARTEGRLDAVYVSLGDHLRAGDIIARIEPSAISQQLSIAESSVRSSEAEEKSARLELEEAEHRYSRRETLAEAGILSREELASARVLVERAKNQLEVARARVSEQIARVDEAKESLGHTHVRASFTGTVSVRYLDPGATVRPGVPIINLTRSSDVWVRVAIPLTKAVTIEPGTAISFTPEGLHVAIPGVVQHKSPGLSSAAQELLIEAKLNAPARYSEWVKPGATGVVSLPDTGGLAIKNRITGCRGVLSVGNRLDRLVPQRRGRGRAREIKRSFRRPIADGRELPVWVEFCRSRTSQIGQERPYTQYL